MRVILAVDQPPIRRTLAAGARRAGIAVDECDSGAAALSAVAAAEPDLVVLDLRRPGVDAVEAVRDLRRRAPTVPVLLMQADPGCPAADETVLGAEILALLAASPGGAAVRCGDLELRPGQRRALYHGVDLGCTPCEFRILELLALHRGGIVGGAELLRVASPSTAPVPASNVVAQWVSRLRTKLRLHGGGDLIETRRGLGYAFVG